MELAGFAIEKALFGKWRLLKLGNLNAHQFMR